MNRNAHPVYCKGLDAYRKCDQRGVLKYLRSPGLSQIEKDLLKALLLNQKQKWQETRTLLTKHGEPADRFIAAELCFIRASAGFCLGGYEEAAKLNHKAWRYYAAIGDRRGQFISLYNLSADHNRMGLKDLSLHFLEESMNYVEWPSERSLVLRGLACHYSSLNDYKKACDYLKQAFAFETLLGEVDLFTLRNVAADIYARAGQMDTALEMLTHIRTSKVNRERARVEFQYRLLECLQGAKKLGPPPEAIMATEYLEKWKLLRALQEGEIEEARKLWAELRSQNPRFYGVAFELQDSSEEKSIFGRILTALHAHGQQVSNCDKPIYTKTTRRLFEVLLETKVPLRKEFLIEAIWGEKYNPRYDARFYKLVERFKRSGSARVRCVNRAYQLMA